MLSRNSVPPEPKTPGVVMAAAYADGKRVADVGIGQAGDWADKDGHLVWIGLYEPSAELLSEIQDQFGLHPLAIEDARNAHQRPKLERYGDCLFVSPAPPSSSRGGSRSARRRSSSGGGSW